MLEKIKEQKLRIALIVIVGSLIFYAVGNLTNFFGNPMFSMFWIISNETAHNIATYAAVAGAAVVVIIGLTVNLIKKRKITKPQTTYMPVISNIKPTNQTLVRATLVTNTPKMNNKSKEYKIEQKNEPPKQPIIKITEQTTQKTIYPTVEQNKTNSQKIETSKPMNGKLTCSNCKKEFSTPLFMLEYIQSKPKLVRHCPYCDQPLD